MDLQLDGKRAIVTGSSGGIGESIAKTLAREGVAVVVQGRNKKEAQRIAQEIEADGGQAVIALGDLGTDEHAQQVVDTAIASLGGVDILVNNAGAFVPHGLMDATSANWAEIYNSDVISMIRMVQRLVPEMKKRGWGRIINLAAGAATQPRFVAPDYAAAKAATVNLTVSLAQQLSGTGINCNTVSPGPIPTAGFQKMWFEIARQEG